MKIVSTKTWRYPLGAATATQMQSFSFNRLHCVSKLVVARPIGPAFYQVATDKHCITWNKISILGGGIRRKPVGRWCGALRKEQVDDGEVQLFVSSSWIACEILGVSWSQVVNTASSSLDPVSYPITVSWRIANHQHRRSTESLGSDAMHPTTISQLQTEDLANILRKRPWI